MAPLLCSIKERYFSRLSVDIDPGGPGFEGARWIASEDVNVEHPLNVFTTADAASDGVWGACADFIQHILWHKPRLSTLGPKIERLPDDHPAKLECLFRLSRLFQVVGNPTERKRVLTHTLALSRERWDDHRLAQTLGYLSRVHLSMGSYKEGMQQAKEGLEVSERLGDTVEQARCLIELALLLWKDNQLDAAEEAASRALNLLPEEGKQSLTCQFHHVLGMIYCSKDDTEKAIHHYEVALGIASSFNWHDALCYVHSSMAQLFSKEGEFGDARTHVEHVKSYAVNSHNPYLLAGAMQQQASLWSKQKRFEEAKSEGHYVLSKCSKSSEPGAMWRKPGSSSSGSIVTLEAMDDLVFFFSFFLWCSYKLGHLSETWRSLFDTRRKCSYTLVIDFVWNLYRVSSCDHLFVQVVSLVLSP